MKIKIRSKYYYMIIGFISIFFISLFGITMADIKHNISFSFALNEFHHYIIPIFIGILGSVVSLLFWISKKHQIEAYSALVESETKFKAITDSAADAIILLDNEGNIAFWNNAAVRIFGYQKAEIIGKKIEDILIPEKYKNAHSSNFQIFRHTGKGNAINKTIELEALRRNGEVFPIELSLSAIKLKEKWNALAIVRDITNRKKGELALIEREKELFELNATKDKFFSIISHDLISPFAALLGSTELLLLNSKKYDNTKKEKFIKSIYESSNKAYKLVENLLLWSRIQLKGIKFNPKIINLNSLIDENILLFQNQANHKKINLIAENIENLQVYADTDMINTVLRNLISNAIKFTPNNGKINIYTNKIGDFIKLTIADTGVGILKEELPKLFRIDENYSTEGTNNEQGTGLGLILCKEFIEKHGGKIWVESEVDKGSKFIFTLKII